MTSAPLMKIFSPSKTNLYLRITDRRPDGFHELETLMIPLSLGDWLEIQENTSGKITLSCNMPGVPCDESNLVLKALRILQKTLRVPDRGLHIHIEKSTPMGGGMGGGSSNGAVTLKALNELWHLGCSESQLEGFAAQFGSDCSFFIKAKPAICTGRGEKIHPVSLIPELHLVMVNPGFGVSTKWAYEAYAHATKQIAPPIGQLLERINAGELSKLQGLMFNSLESPVLKKYLLLNTLKEDLITSGALASMMSGSGATVFGLAASADSAVQIAQKMREIYGEKLFIASCQTLS